MRAHPRSRGENQRSGDSDRAEGGSSPLTRGKLRVFPPVGRVCGLIPAHAGKTSSVAWSPSMPRAHPRSRGENTEPTKSTPVLTGSSPLTRGKRLQGEADPVACRLIPAHAGKTGSFETLFIKSGAHPRSRGENEIVIALVRSGTGSSPLTRGKRASARSWSRSRRLIPAHAGKTLKTASIAPVDWAHPRSRGENNQPRSWTVELGGSSPLTRGKQSAIARGPRLVGLIPAHAGKTRPKNRRKSASRAHPRSRGENQVEGHLRVVLAGSSPLTRGKPAASP